MCVSNCRGAGWTCDVTDRLSLYQGQSISDTATVKNGEGVFTHTSPRSSAPVTDRGTPAVNQFVIQKSPQNAQCFQPPVELTYPLIFTLHAIHLQ